jgi:cytochrome c biogenesis protein CcmG/thiol:disulfide interchange protein DsbE
MSTDHDPEQLRKQSTESTSEPTSKQVTKTINKKQLKLWFLIPLIVFFGLFVMLYMRLGQPTEIVTNTAVERPVPTFELPLLSDTTRTMTSSNLPEQPFLINVWGSWCPTCIVEHPFLMELEQRGINIVGVNYKDEIGNALRYLNQRGDPFSMSIQDLSGQFALDLGLTGAPETFVVDGEGVIRQHIIGEINESNWQSRIMPCLTVLNEADSNNTSLLAAELQEVCK